MSATEQFARQLAVLAEDQARAIGERFGVELDFSPASLERLDELAERPGFSEALSESDLTGLGVYVGEVIRRNLGASWVEARGTRDPPPSLRPGCGGSPRPRKHPGR